MIIPLLKLILGKVIGIDTIPPEQRKEYWKKLGEYSTTLASKMAEGAAKGLASEAKHK